MQKSPLVLAGEDSQLEKAKFGVAETSFGVKGTINELNGSRATFGMRTIIPLIPES